MSDRKKTFNLGDIIRKLNESNGTEKHEQQEAHDRHEPRAPRVNRPQSPAGLPPQPNFGAAKTPPPPRVVNRPQTESQGTPPPIPGTYNQEAGSAEKKELTHNSGSTPPAKGPSITPVLHSDHMQKHHPTHSSGHDDRNSKQGAEFHRSGSQLGENESEDEEFDILRYVTIILRRRNLILFICLIATIYSLYNYLTSDKYYSARARMLYQPSSSDIISGGPARGWIGHDKQLNTHLELLKSREVLNRASDNLNRRVNSGIIRSVLNVQQEQINGQKTDIIQVSAKYEDPVLTRDIINEVCKTYIEYHREVKAQEDTRFILRIKTQIDKQQRELDAKEEVLKDFKERNRMVQLSNETNLIMNKLSNMELALQQTHLDYLEAKKKIQTLQNQIGKQEINVVQTISYDNTYQNRIRDLELQLSTLTAEYGPEHFRVKNIRSQIENLKKVLASDVKKKAATQTTFVKNPIRESLLQELVQASIDMSTLETKRVAQEQIVEKLNNELTRLPGLEKEYANLVRETESHIQTLKMLRTKYEQARIRRESQESDLRILELAITPKRAIPRVHFKNVLIGALVGLLLGIALAFLLEYLDQTIKDPGEVEKALELPLLGFVPLIQTDKALIEDSEKLAKSIAEPFRAVRANMKHVIAQNHLRSIIICSAVKGEGKTTLAANLAITFALDGKKVVLVDCDLRRPQTHKLFNLDKETGVADYLLGDKSAPEIMKETKYPNLTIITCGTPPQNPAELIGTPKFEVLIEELKKKFDIVFCDSPALLPVSDVITIAPKFDGVMMVIRTLWTPLKAAKQAKNQLKRIGCTIYGGILNGVSHSRGYYPYYYGYYGYYSYKYSYDYDKEPKKPFNMRELGINLESSLKSFFRNVRLSIPRYTAVTAQFFRQLIHRKTFWFLIAVVLVLAFVEKQTRPVPGSDRYIEYLSPRSAETAKASGPKPETQTESGSPAAQRAPSAIDVVPIEKSAASASRMENVNTELQLERTLDDWILAYNAKDSTRFYNYYNEEKFSYPGGTLQSWKHAPENDLEIRSDTVHWAIDSTKLLPIKRGYYQTHVWLRNLDDNSSETKEYILIWQCNSNTCSIIRQKRGR